MPGGEMTSEQVALVRFDTEPAAAKYEGALDGTRTHRREVRCIARALAGVPRGGRVLDLPCGTGRLLPDLVGMGYRVTAADASHHMLQRAREHIGQCAPEHDVSFCVSQAANTAFDDGAFDAVVCNRLLHHFREAAARRGCLEELRRICRGVVVASFFRNLAVDAWLTRLRNAVRGHRAHDRIPVSLQTFFADAQAAGLAVTAVMGKRPYVSEQWYAVMAPLGASHR